MEEIRSFITATGCMTVLFIIARIFSRCLKSLESKSKAEPLQKILVALSVVLYFLTAPIGIMYFVVEIPEYKKQAAKYEREIRDLEVKQICLEANHREKCSKIKDASFASGYRGGYKDALSGHAPLFDDEVIQ